MKAAKDLVQKLLQMIDNASIGTKVMLAPAIAVICGVLLLGATFYMFQADESNAARLDSLTTRWLEPMTRARTGAAMLQADLFRLTALGLMGASADNLHAAADRIQREELQLQSLLGDPPGQNEAPETRAALLASYRSYRSLNANAVVDFLRNPGWGATTARNAAIALDAVISATTTLHNVAEAQVRRDIATRNTLHARMKWHVLVVMAVGSLGVILANTLIGWRISAPLRSLTAAMVRMADRHYDQEIPATGSNDEVGSMARAVLVFRQSLIRTDAITEELQSTKTLLDTVLTHLPIPITVKEAATLRYVLFNPAAAQFGPARLERGRTAAEAHFASDAAMLHEANLAALASGGLTVQRDLHFFAGTPHQRIADVIRMVVNDADGKPRYLISALLDLTERRQSEQRLAYMAHYDSLTDLPNRYLFTERLGEALNRTRQKGTQIAIIAANLDRFKEVNDTLGHATGDKLLQLAASRLKNCLGNGDMIARLGGDEFAIIQENIKSAVETEALANRLIASTRDAFEIGDQKFCISLSAGCAVSDAAVTAAELVQQADLALYDAKQGGRGIFRFYAAKLSARLHERRTLEQDLRIALNAGDLSLHYQPSVSLGSGAIAGTEALMRWNHPIKGAIPPSIFIPLAEETGLIGALGLWLLDEACHEAAIWPAPIRVAVNVSPIQFRTPGFAAHVANALAASGLDPGRLELEITEGVLMRDTAEILAILSDLREIGVRIALDDFGTGYSSLSYLQTFSFDKLKIDRSFVKDIETDPTALAILRSVIGLSDSLNMTTTAEGIEEQTQADLLRILGCGEAQGYLFWRPMPAPTLRAILEKRAAPMLETAEKVLF